MVEDRISALPETVLLHVLSFLPTKEAVATSVLAQKWKYLWHSVSSLDFNHGCFSSTIDSKEKYLHFVQSVYIALNSGDLHRPIERFRLRCSSSFCDATNFNVWINVAVQRRVEHLDISLNHHCNSPLAIPSCRTLVLLNLEGLSVKVPSSIDLPSLKILYLNEISFSEREDFAELLHGSPVIEDLEATDLKFDDSSSEIQFERLPKLVKACINNLDFPLKAINNVKFLQLDWMHEMDEEEEANPIYKELIPFFPNLTEVELTDQSMTDYWIEIVVEVLKNSPKLQSLSIDKGVDYEELLYEIDESEWTFPQIIPECISCHLKTFYFNNYIGSEGEFQLVSYIMENATPLQSMTINSPSIAGESEKLEMLKKLSMCRRRSSNCRLSFT